MKAFSASYFSIEYMKLKFYFNLKFKCFFLFQLGIISATWSLSLIFENLRDFLRSFSMGTLQLLKTDEKLES